MDSSQPTPWTVRKIAASALIDLGTTASRSISRIWEAAPAPGTAGARLLHGRSAAETSISDVSVMMASATDHFHAIARLLKLEEAYGPSIATLTRGFIEASGRAWWLLDAVEDPRLFEHRAAVLAKDEAKYVVKNSAPVRRIFPDGATENVTIEAFQAEAASRLETANTGQRVVFPGYSSSAVNVLTAAEVPHPALLYSQLSGIAHGEPTTLGALGTVSAVDPDGHALGIPIVSYRACLQGTTYVLHFLMDQLTGLFGARSEQERWVQTKERVWHTLGVLDDRLDAAE